ncbi:MAG: ATP synthase F1 subunit delta [Gammaproteobacteria bacterium RIFCSPHIGHO2_12_FULL_41_20]|nr:MAG: ATP synthase F1 subunit delta [Gammaproteobacteria bacterium RIFCSPHIGHO2_12_FULL_41_20]
MTAGMITIARPYALAAFEYAHDKKELAGWKAFLDSAAYLIRNDSMVSLIANPAISSSQLLHFICDILMPLLDAKKKNFLHVLADNKRLIVLPDIAALFNTYYAEAEKMVKVRVVTAVAINDTYRHKLMDALANRLRKHIAIECEIDPSILGGAIIRIGDRVIDGSVRGKLNRLLAFSLG